MIDFEKINEKRRAKMSKEQKEHEDKYKALVNFNVILNREYNLYRGGLNNIFKTKICKIYRKVDFDTLEVSNDVTIDFDGPYWHYALDERFFNHFKDADGENKFYLDRGAELYMLVGDLKRILVDYLALADKQI